MTYARSTDPCRDSHTDRLASGWWAQRHSDILDALKLHENAKLLLLGDSITQNYEKSNPPDEEFLPVWKQYYASRDALNLGFSGDTTSDLLWRVCHGEIEGLHPTSAIVLIGTNDTITANRNAGEIADGIQRILDVLHRRLPQMSILVIGILPSDISAAKTDTDKTVNQRVQVLCRRRRYARYIDLASVFMRDSKLELSLFYDPRLRKSRPALHPDSIGQRRMAEAIDPVLKQLMHEVEKPVTHAGEQ
jgi:lysophospholipase L1-like esterase